MHRRILADLKFPARYKIEILDIKGIARARKLLVLLCTKPRKVSDLKFNTGWSDV